jgi:hypothetical protein
LKKINELWEAVSEGLQDVDHILSVITYQPFPPTPKGSSNAFGLAPGSNGELVIFIVSIYWRGDEGADLVSSKAKLLIEQIGEVTKEEGFVPPLQVC